MDWTPPSSWLHIDVDAATPVRRILGLDLRPFVALAGVDEFRTHARLDAGAVHLRVQIAARRQHAVAQHFRFQTPNVLTPKEQVLAG